MADAQANQRQMRQGFVLSRERSFVRPPSQFQHYLYHQPILQKRVKNVDLQAKNANKPTMELYRPPSVRTEGMPDGINPRLNVHAKEFTMNYQQLQPSRSSGNILVAMDPYYQPYKLQSSLSTPRVHFCLQPLQDDVELIFKQQQMALAQAQAQLHQQQPKQVQRSPEGVGKLQRNATSPEGLKQVRFQASDSIPNPPLLQRSKSLGAADILARQAAAGNMDVYNELGELPPVLLATIYKARQDPNAIAPRVLMELVYGVMKRVLESRKFAEPAAKLCMTIIERERKETFLETLLNTCQQWYQERDQYLLTPSGTKVPAFMAFLHEMYCQLKRRQLQLKTHKEGVPPGLVLLTLLCKCCQDCLKPSSISSLVETESLFFVLTAIGKDLEQELPQQLDGLLSSVRDAFLTAQTSSPIRKTLLQLIELSAAKWNLPAPAVMYYYPGSRSN